MPKNQNTLPCNLDKKTRTTQDVHFSAPSQLPEVTRTQAISGTRLYHCSAAEIASTSGFATAVSQHVGDNAYEIIGPDDESSQGANHISVAEVSPIPPEVTMTGGTAAIDTETTMSTAAATVYEASSSVSASAAVSEGTAPGLVEQHVCYHCDFFCSAFAQHTKAFHHDCEPVFLCSKCETKLGVITQYKHHFKICKHITVVASPASPHSDNNVEHMVGHTSSPLEDSRDCQCCC
ncbi:uncharacterized protein [Dermacentor albipictus]|uniref:uncharacterized protein n=1 Tax=Dermacentor albipictus TaxID=60249 RepID=UPI0038FD235C